MDNVLHLHPDIDVLPSHFPIPGMGFLAVNAFVINAAEPVLVDTGMGMESEDFMNALKSVIALKDLKCVWLTHDDMEHTGSLQEVLEKAPKARLAANSLAVLRMSTAWSIPMDRVYWLNPGDSIHVGDRNLMAVRPPLFDNPTTIAIYDDNSEAFFSADCFGAIIPRKAGNVDDLTKQELIQGMTSWASGDSPWVHKIEPNLFKKSLDDIRNLDPKIILSAHLPPAFGKTEEFLESLTALPSSTPFVAPGQNELKKMMA